MKKINFLLFLFLTLAVSLTASAQNAPTFAPNHLAAAERVIYAVGIPENFIIPTRTLLQRSAEKDPANADLMTTVFDPYLQKKYIAEQFKQFVAAQFNLDTSRQIAKFWESPVGRKLFQGKLELLKTGTPPTDVFTAADKAAMKKFESTRAFQAFQAAMPTIEEWQDEFMKTTHTEMRDKFLKELEKRNAAKAGK